MSGLNFLPEDLQERSGNRARRTSCRPCRRWDITFLDNITPVEQVDRFRPGRRCRDAEALPGSFRFWTGCSSREHRGQAHLPFLRSGPSPLKPPRIFSISSSLPSVPRSMRSGPAEYRLAAEDAGSLLSIGPQLHLAAAMGTSGHELRKFCRGRQERVAFLKF